jgi:hypothetical protein
MMKHNSALNWLVPLTAVLALISAAAGLFWQDGGAAFSFTSVHGQTVAMFGEGLYRNDTLMAGAAFRGTDAITLVVALPLLAISYWFSQGGSLRGHFLLTAVMSYFLYNATQMAFAAAYNNLFLVYIAYFSASLFGFILSFTAIKVDTLPARVTAGVPYRGIAIFLFVTGLAPLLLWGSELVIALLHKQTPPLLGSYTTLITHAVDLAVIVPTVYLAGVLLLRRAPLGYLLAFIILTLLALIGLVVAAQTIVQLQVGIVYEAGVLIGMVGSWLLLGVIALWLVVRLLRHITPGNRREAATLQAIRA